jgi:hypothetical protein
MKIYHNFINSWDAPAPLKRLDASSPLYTHMALQPNKERSGSAHLFYSSTKQRFILAWLTSLCLIVMLCQNGKKNGFSLTTLQELELFCVGSQSTKNMASTSSYILLIHHLKRTQDKLFCPNELQNGSGSSREAKELEPKPEAVSRGARALPKRAKKNRAACQIQNGTTSFSKTRMEPLHSS